MVVEPVLMAPLRREWAEIQAQVRLLADQLGALDEAADADRTAAARTQRRGKRTVLRGKALALLTAFREKLAAVQILDAACGSGNFLYVALRLLLDLEKEVINLAATLGEPISLPLVSPAQLHGIEINPYAYELAQTTIWIGYIQWLRDNGFGLPTEPILKPLNTFRQMDAILARIGITSQGGRGQGSEPEWPAADVIIGNPPFLGDKKMRAELGRRVRGRAAQAVRRAGSRRSGSGVLLVRAGTGADRRREGEASQGCWRPRRSAAGQIGRVLERIKETGDIFWAWSDRDGFWTAQRFAFRWSVLTMELRQTRELDGQAAASNQPDFDCAST